MIEATHFADGETGRERAGRVQAGDAGVGGPSTAQCDNQSSSADSDLSGGHSNYVVGSCFPSEKKALPVTQSSY